MYVCMYNHNYNGLRLLKKPPYTAETWYQGYSFAYQTLRLVVLLMGSPQYSAAMRAQVSFMISESPLGPNLNNR